MKQGGRAYPTARFAINPPLLQIQLHKLLRLGIMPPLEGIILIRSRTANIKPLTCPRNLHRRPAGFPMREVAAVGRAGPLPVVRGAGPELRDRVEFPDLGGCGLRGGGWDLAFEEVELGVATVEESALLHRWRERGGAREVDAFPRDGGGSEGLREVEREEVGVCQ